MSKFITNGQSPAGFTEQVIMYHFSIDPSSMDAEERQVWP